MYFACSSEVSDVISEVGKVIVTVTQDNLLPKLIGSRNECIFSGTCDMYNNTITGHNERTFFFEFL